MPDNWGAYLQQQSTRLLQLAANAYGREFPLPSIATNLRGMQAGQAFVEDNHIRLNQQLLREHGEAFVNDTLPHELAHLVVYQLHGRRVRPHGDEWEAVMALFGAKPERCHNYNVQPARKLPTYTYFCACRKHDISAIRHRRIQRGGRYLCLACGEALYRRRRTEARPVVTMVKPEQLSLPLWPDA